MRVMKDSHVEWLGKIPSNWNCMKNKFLLNSTYSGGTPTATNNDFYSTSGTPFVSISDMSSTNYVRKTEKYVTEAGMLDKNLKILPKGTILYSMYATVGHVAELEIDATISQAMIALFINNILDKTYYKYCLQAMKEYIFSSAEGTTQMNLNAQKVLGFIFPIPSFDEQNAIVSFLNDKCNKIEESIVRHENIIKKLEEYRNSEIENAVTNGTGNVVEFSKGSFKWIGEVPSGWKLRRLKYASTNISKGNGITKEDIRENGDIKCVRYGEIYTNYNYCFDDCVTKTDLSIIDAPKTFENGDILFAATGELIEEIGKCIVYTGNEKCLAGSDIIIMQHNQIPKFMAYLLNSSYVQAQKSFGKSKLKVVHIYANEIANILVALPPLEEQIKIASYLDDKCYKIDSTINRHIEIIEKLKEYRKSLIYNAVTGKIDCREEENEA